MIIEVLDANGNVPDPPVQASFDKAGGTIGRASTNHLPLPDPNRTVSRVHAQIVLRKDGMRIISRSTNPLLIDGQPLDIGEETGLREGALIVIGDYHLRASGTGA